MSRGRNSTVGRGRGRALWAVFALGVFALLCFAPGAVADLEFCLEGPGAGQCAPPTGINGKRGLALDFENGRLYVADKANNRVDVFAEEGAFLFAFGWGVDTGAAELETCTAASTCEKGLEGSGAGELTKPTKVAVDNDPASPSFHDVYVVEEATLPSEVEDRRVEKFDPTGAPGTPVEFIRSIGSKGEAEGQFESELSIGVGPGGDLYVLDNVPSGGKFKHRLQRFKPSGELIPPQCILFEGGRAVSLAVDSAGSFWVASQGEGRGTRKYDSTCTPLFLAEDSDEIENIEVAVDEGGRPFVAQGEGPFQVITTYDSVTGALAKRFGYDRIPSKPEGLAAREGGEGGLFLTLPNLGNVIRRLEFPQPTPELPPPGPIAAPSSLEAVGIGAAKATLVAEVNPEGKATQVHFEYVGETKYLEDIAKLGPGHGFDNAKSTPIEPLGAEGFELKTAEATAGCPNPLSEAGEPGKCLNPLTKYRFRVIATNADGGGEGTVEAPPPFAPFETKNSPDLGEAWATEVGTGGARLHAEVNPQGVPTTGWFEYVDDATYQRNLAELGDGFAEATEVPDVEAGQTPLDFGGGEAFVAGAAVANALSSGTVYHYRLVAENPLIKGPVAGEERTLRTFEPVTESPSCANEAARIGAGALLPDCRAYEMVSPLDKAGGDIKVLKTSRGDPAVLEQSADSGEELAYGSVRSFGDAPSGPYTSQYIAQRVAGEEWRTHGISPPRGRPLFGAGSQLNTEFRAFSSDLCQGWLGTVAEPPLGEGGVPGLPNIYRRSDRLCGSEEYEALAPRTPLAIPVEKFSTELQGVSADSTHTTFTSNVKLSEEGSEGQQQLYETVGAVGPRLVCILGPGGKPVSGSCAAGSSTISANPGARTGVISSDGERIFWSTPAGGEGKLYVRIGGSETVAVSEAAEKETGTVHSWFWGAAADGSKAVFTTTKAEAGISDLYAFDVDGKTTQPIAEGVYGVAGISADARRIYFASSKVLAAGASAGQPNLYLYEAGEGGGSIGFVATLANADVTEDVSPEPYYKHTSRVTPDGAHVAFTSVAPLTGYDNKRATGGQATREIYRYDAVTKKLICASCNPSGARPAAPAEIPAFETSMHAARVLSDDGRRLFFESGDALAARDTNGTVDVYEWEEAGTGGCEEGDADFAPSADGCIELISSGQSPLDSRFVESSPDGHDVFFATGSSLLPQDYGLVDIYDARVEGGLPIPPTPPPPCEGDACSPQIGAPEEPGTASSEYRGPPAIPKSNRKGHCAKGKRQVAKKGKSRCVAKPKRHHQGRAGR